MSELLVLHAACTLAMAGAIWIVQVVHYPLFASVGAAQFPDYALAHQRLITLVVGPLMLGEVLTGLALAWSRLPWAAAWERWAGLALLGAIWVSTALIQVPQHGALAAGFDAGTHRALVAGNWLRTVAWTARAALVSLWLLRALRAGGAP